MKRYLIVIYIALLVTLGSTSVGLAQVQQLIISQEMELLGGVLAQTSWESRRGPANGGNEYYRALKEFFAPYQEHQAITLAQDFTNRGFTFDAPPAFIAHLGPLPHLNVANEYSAYLIKRAGNRERLENFRIALKDLAEESNFLEFFTSWQPYLDQIVKDHSEGFRPTVVTQWLEDFFGWPADQFYLLLTPSMFPGGGYGATVTGAEGQLIAYQMIRENGRSTGRPEFPTGISLEHLTLHELGHSFVNPSIGEFPKRAYFLRPLFLKVEEEMNRQAYTTVDTFLNEQVLRAMEVIAVEELYGKEKAVQVANNHKERAFYLTDFVVEHLRYYRGNRDQYPTFKEFVPYLYDKLEEYQGQNFSFWQRARGIIPF